MPHFDYASVVYKHLDKRRCKCLQVAHNACIRFITGYVPFIPSQDVKSHVTHCRLKLGWLSLASRRFLQLLVLFYRVASTSSPDHLHRLIEPPPPQKYNPTYVTRAPRPYSALRGRGRRYGTHLSYWSETGEPTQYSGFRTSADLRVKSMGFQHFHGERKSTPGDQGPIQEVSVRYLTSTHCLTLIYLSTRQPSQTAATRLLTTT